MTPPRDQLLADLLLDQLANAASDAALEDFVARLEPVLRDRLFREPRNVSGRWLSTAKAAEHLAISVAALHKLTAARALPFEQAGPGCKCWFRPEDLDEWRRGRSHR